MPKLHRICALLVIVLSAPLTAAQTKERSSRATQEQPALAREARLEDVLGVALRDSPELHEARARTRAAAELAPAASRLPEPELEYQLWAAPLARPYALDEAEMHMFGVRQSIPPLGALSERSEARAAEARADAQLELARRRDLEARVRRAFAEYRRADSERRIHLEHVRVAQETLDVVRGAYAAGQGRQRDVLDAMLTVSRLHADIVSIQRDLRSAVALLNTLMARPLQAPLGPPEPFAEGESGSGNAPPVAVRPELKAAELAVQARMSDTEAARAAARWPALMLGVQYMFMPAAPEPHNYGVMVSASLPWLSPRYGEELRAAESALAAERSALSNARLVMRYEAERARERLSAAREAIAILDRDVLPLASSSLEAARAAYAGGQGDALALLSALRSLLDARVERARALRELELSIADARLTSGAEDVPAEEPPR